MLLSPNCLNRDYENTELECERCASTSGGSESVDDKFAA